MADMPVVDWSALRPQATGPRTYSGPEVAAPAIWNCPACAAQNTTPLAQGCPSCGSGKPGQHVGVDPVITAEERQRLLSGGKPGRLLNEPMVPTEWVKADNACHVAFAEWAEDQQLGAAAVISSYSAFKAGWNARGGTHVDHSPRPDRDLAAADSPADAVPPLEAAPDEPVADFKGTPEQRTILAALIYFRDQVLPEAAEEIGTGQWLSVQDVNTIIARLEQAIA